MVWQLAPGTLTDGGRIPVVEAQLLGVPEPCTSPRRTVPPVRDDPSWPTVNHDMVRLRIVGGRLGGLVVDLPEALAEIEIDQLVATADGGLYDRTDNCRPVPAARVLRLPSAARRVVTPTVCPSYL